MVAATNNSMHNTAGHFRDVGRGGMGVRVGESLEEEEICNYGRGRVPDSEA